MDLWRRDDGSVRVNRDREYVLDNIYNMRVRDVKFNFTKHIQHRGSGDDSLWFFL
jgi:hypothetical protein